jgi:hypothetical protein
MRRTVAAVCAVVLLCSLFVGVAGAAHGEPDRTVLGLEVGPEGSASVYYVTSYDLSEDDERAAYERYADNESRQAEFRDAAVSELRAAAGNGSEATGYDMSIRNASVRTYEADGYGRVEVEASWHALAYYDRRRVIVFEPFRAGYRPDRDVAIHGPEGYRRNRTAPQPVRARRNSVLISTRTSDLSNFFVEFVDPDAATPTATSTATATATATETPPDDGGAGDAGVAIRALVLALLPAALFVAAMRRN